MVERQSLKKAIEKLESPVVVAYGNPLLDVAVILDDASFLKKYGLSVEGEMELAEDIIQEIMANLSPEHEERVAPGGCAQNTLRILQWLCGGSSISPVAIYCGGLGKDSRGSTLEKMVKASGVQTKYAVHSSIPTGVCLSLSNGASRCLMANLGAARSYTLADLKNSHLSFDDIKIIYMEGFFLTHSLDVAKEVVKLTQNKNAIIAFNLNGEYVFEAESDSAAVCEMVGLSKIVFGNTREMTALAKALNLKFDNVADIPFLLNSSKRVTVGVSSEGHTSDDWLMNNDIFVMTQGGTAPAIVVWGHGHSAQVQPTKPKDPVIDATGAGDALVAGFLAGILAGGDPKSCLETGCKVAAMMVTRLGVTLPNDIPDGIFK